MPKPNQELSYLTFSGKVRPSGRLWNPAADVYRTDQGWLVKVDLAGICSDELEIVVDSSHLRISGCRRDTNFKEGFTYQQMEITYSRFEKTIQFPVEIGSASLERHYSDGFLLITLNEK
ncbi:MAG TPA: Hsp20/alpha crystallin family protein [Pyrinomonadaceae bacterium]|jgi:HSP20 family protein